MIRSENYCFSYFDLIAMQSKLISALEIRKFKCIEVIHCICYMHIIHAHTVLIAVFFDKYLCPFIPISSKLLREKERYRRHMIQPHATFFCLYFFQYFFFVFLYASIVIVTMLMCDDFNFSMISLWQYLKYRNA